MVPAGEGPGGTRTPGAATARGSGAGLPQLRDHRRRVRLDRRVLAAEADSAQRTAGGVGAGAAGAPRQHRSATGVGAAARADVPAGGAGDLDPRRRRPGALEQVGRRWRAPARVVLRTARRNDAVARHLPAAVGRPVARTTGGAMG